MNEMNDPHTTQADDSAEAAMRCRSCGRRRGTPSAPINPAQWATGLCQACFDTTWQAPASGRQWATGEGPDGLPYIPSRYDAAAPSTLPAETREGRTDWVAVAEDDSRMIASDESAAREWAARHGGYVIHRYVGPWLRDEEIA